MGVYDKLNAVPSQSKKPGTDTVTTKPVESKTDSGINIPSYQATNIPEYANEIVDPYIRSIHRALREPNHKAASYRVSDTEKKRLTVAIFQLSMKNIYTNENEIMRIALNHLMNGYDEEQEESVLVKVLRSLRV
jgi:hypothetical protein